MILKGILYLIWGFIYSVTLPLRLLPDVSLPANMTNAISSANSYINAVDFILPVTTLVAVIGIILVVETSIFTYKMIMWVIRKIPGVS